MAPGPYTEKVLMSLSHAIARSRNVIACLIVVLVGALAAPAASARDQSEYGRYLGTRLRLYAEAYDILDKMIQKGTPAEQRRAKQYKAEVMKSEADYNYTLDGDDSKRRDRYKDALDVFGDPDNAQGILDKAVMRYEVAKALQRINPEEARDQCDKAILALDASRQALEAVRSNEAEWAKVYAVYSKTFYNYCVGYYVKSLSYDLGSGERLALLAECGTKLGDFQFGLETPTLETVLSYELQGDVEVARGAPVEAVGKFLGLVGFLDSADANSYVGAIALEHGYLRAAEILTTDLDYDPKYLQQTVDLYAAAFKRFGTMRDLDIQFKSFQLYRISALIKLGDPAQIQGAIDALFKLAQDRDAGFRRQALSVLADIAVRDKLDNELRFRCATAAYKELDTLPVSVLIKLAQAHQALLTACGDLTAFETFAPACFERAGNIYSRMWRFLDATLVYREAAVRTAYFATKFTEESAVPAHMQGRTEMIVDGKSLMEFPGKMAGEYAKHAAFLTSPKYGEPGNKEFEKLLKHANEVKASLGGENAKLDLAYNDAVNQNVKRAIAQAAVRFASLPARYRKFYLALSQAAAAYYELTYAADSQRIASSGAKEERESDQWFQEQKDRHATDLAKLPESMWKGVEAHWDVVLDRNTPGPVANWHKAVYFFKKYFLIEALREWEQVEPLVKDKEKPDFLDAIFAVAQAKNTKWLRDNPTGKGEPDADMRRIGVGLYYFVYLLRTPPDAFGADGAAKIKQENRAVALRVLGQFWKLFGVHLAGKDDYKQRVLKMAFYALAESRDADAAEESYLAYSTAFPADDKEIARMVSNVYALLIDELQPRTNAMQLVSSGLRSRSNQLKKGLFAGVNAQQYPEAAKKVADAKGEVEKQKALAAHFWNDWMIAKIFGGENAEAVTKVLPDIQPLVKQRWDDLAAVGIDRWGDAVAASLKDLLPKETYKPARALVEKETAGVDKLQLVDKIKALRDKQGLPDDQVQAVTSLYNALVIDTEQLRYFQGTIFIYEFGDFLETVAADVDERARPLITRILRYYQEYRVKTGKAAEGLEAKDLLTLGKQYFRIRDWENAIRYLQEFIDKNGTVREYGKEEEIAVDMRAKEVGRAKAGEELEIKYQLGKSYLERYKEKGSAEDLKKAALLLRRCWCFNLARDANEIAKKPYKLRFQSEIEDYYLYIGQSMAEAFLLLHMAKDDIKIDWPKYANQYTVTLEVDKKEPLQEVPTDKASALWQARIIHLRLWTSFRQLDSYQYRDEFRNALLAWMELGIQWVKTYGKKDMGIKQLVGPEVDKTFADTLNVARNEGLLSAVYLNDTTKQYLARLKSLADSLEAACKSAGIKAS